MIHIFTDEEREKREREQRLIFIPVVSCLKWNVSTQFHIKDGDRVAFFYVLSAI